MTSRNKGFQSLELCEIFIYEAPQYKLILKKSVLAKFNLLNKKFVKFSYNKTKKLIGLTFLTERENGARKISEMKSDWRSVSVRYFLKNFNINLNNSKELEVISFKNDFLILKHFN